MINSDKKAIYPLIITFIISSSTSFYTVASPSKVLDVGKENVIYKQSQKYRLQPGDIVFRSARACEAFTHSLIFVEYDKEKEEYIFIEANIYEDVTFAYYSEERVKNQIYNTFARLGFIPK